jgi:hypothetical protein
MFSMFTITKMLEEKTYYLAKAELIIPAAKTIRALVAALSLLAIFSRSMASAGEDSKHVEMAKTFVTQMAGSQFDKAIESFDQTMSKALPADSLKQIWDGKIKENGAFQRLTETRTEKYLQYEMVFVTCEFQHGMLDAKVVFTSGNKIGGLFFLPSGKYKPPSYADLSKFDEKEIQIGKGIWTLPGTLSLPKGDGPFPAVILVHGSGPLDRDETIGPNKPFRDLAHGLASRGIAVLRYEKRTKEHQIMMAMMASNITVKEETIDDVVSAFNVLASQDKIDSKRIVVLGHSLGGMLIPRIAQAQDKICGFISLAGSTMPLEDLVLEQTRYIMPQDGKLDEELQNKIKEIERQVAAIKSPDLSEKNPGVLLLGAPAKYWLDLRGYEPAKEAMKLRQPMLILQGERDYQVTMENYANWKKALGSRKDVSFITYPDLNHLFIAGKGKSMPVEYSIPGNVAKKVIDDIVIWIGGINFSGT